MASQFNDPGANQLYRAIMDELVEKAKADHLVSQFVVSDAMSEKVYIIPPKRTRYLSEIAESIRSYNDWVVTQSDTADALYSLRQSAQTLADSPLEDKDRLIKQLDEAFALRKRDLDPYNWDLIAAWSDVRASYKAELYTYTVRGKDIKLPTHSKSLSGNAIPKVVTPSFPLMGRYPALAAARKCARQFPLHVRLVSLQTPRRGSYKDVCRRRQPRANQ